MSAILFISLANTLIKKIPLAYVGNQTVSPIPKIVNSKLIVSGSALLWLMTNFVKALPKITASIYTTMTRAYSYRIVRPQRSYYIYSNYWPQTP